MSVSPNTQAVLLLTAHFSNVREEAVKPLTPKEWGRLALWLKEKSLTPEQLMSGRLGELLNGWLDKAITLDRVEGLMARGSGLALAMEKWLRAGLWVMTRSDPDYPARFKQRLRTDAPAILYGCGNRALLNSGGLAVIGSRNATEKDLAYSRELGAAAAGNGYSIVSGGARGVDESSMLGSLKAEGTVIGVLADSLLRSCSSVKYRKYLMADNLVLVSSFYPDAGFNAGNAMQRNKYIYCLCDAAVVVHSGNKGGTWSGAMENLKKKWVTLWVKRTSDEMAGNSAIVKAGGAWVSENITDLDFKELLSTRATDAGSGSDLFNQSTSEARDTDGESSHKGRLEPRPDSMMGAAVASQREGAATSTPSTDIEFYDLFLIKITAMCSDSPKTTDELIEALELNKTQLNCWLKRAVADKRLKKFSKPVRYQRVTARQGELQL
ncbi:MAG: DNA-processing protein DprA [Methyloligellaceae bacterium]